MLDSRVFDLWADNYDNDVAKCSENNKYPFAGYKSVLNYIYKEVSGRHDAKVLDVGFGTGVLTTQLYKCGCNITGLDFSDKMIDIARQKMPKARLIKWDFSKGIPDDIKDSRFDYIIFTYSIHHIPDKEKVNLIKSINTLLYDTGKIIIGDVAFETRNNLEICKQKNAGAWDNNEFYIVISDIKEQLNDICNCKFSEISNCSGILTITKRGRF